MVSSKSLRQALRNPHGLGVDHFAVGLEHAHLAPVLHQLEADTVGFFGLRVEQRDVGDVYRHVLVDDAAGQTLHRVGTLVFLDAVDPFHDEVPRIHDPQHRPALSLVFAGGDDDVVAFSDFFHYLELSAAAGHHTTSGASVTIFMKRSLRSSRVTGPKMRVPIGSNLGVRSTAAFESNRMRLPSARRTPKAVRTTTA